MSDPVDLGAERRRIDAPAARARVVRRLRRLADSVEGGTIRDPADDTATAPITSAVIVLLTEDGRPLVTWAGQPEWGDFVTASHALSDVRGLEFSGRHRAGETITGEVVQWAVIDGWAWRHEARERKASEREAHKRRKPWQCEHCDNRYTSKGWAERHERRCMRNPGADQYRSGEYTATHTDDGGRVTGWSRGGSR